MEEGENKIQIWTAHLFKWFELKHLMTNKDNGKSKQNVGFL